MRTRRALAPLLLLALVASACATTQIQKARTVSVDVHATLAAVQDAEMALYASKAVPGWTVEKHQAFNQHLVVALKAGRALNEGVRTAPVSSGAKVDLATVSGELETLTGLLAGVLPPGHPVVTAVSAAKDAVLALLPLFLE